ncbi:MAG: diadenosine tetraphosphate hydrolase [Patescibacteria group bacterium]
MNQGIEIEDIKGNKKQIGCLGCAIQNRKVESMGGSIVLTKFFNAHQDYEIPIPGFIIISSKRHIQSVDQFTKNEQSDFIKLLCRLRSALRKVLGVEIVYLIQKEDTRHHFHVWLFPRFDWMKKKFGRKISSVSLVAEFAKKNMKTSSNLKKIEGAIKKMRNYCKKEFTN